MAGLKSKRLVDPADLADRRCLCLPENVRDSKVIQSLPEKVLKQWIIFYGGLFHSQLSSIPPLSSIYIR